MKSAIKDVLQIPSFGRGVYKIWHRNFLYFRYTFFAALTWIFVEPLLLLAALGYGLGQFVSEIEGQSYAEFLAPALLTTTGMFVAFFEGTYSTFTKLSRQNTFHTIILAPVDSDEITLGEIAWCTSKALLSVLAMGIVISVLGLVDPLKLAMPILFITLFCWGIAAFSVTLATTSKSYESFSYYQSGVMTTMSLFCGTYFPLEKLPPVFYGFAHALPLTHALKAVRTMFGYGLHADILINFTYLFIFAFIFTNLACVKMRRRLIQ